MKRKVLSLALVLAMIISLIPVFDLSGLAAAADADTDALSALGIDSNKAPDGYDPLSTDNPYGKDTVEISPVYELYKVGLEDSISYDSSYSTTSTLQNGDTVSAHSANANNLLKASLYGHEKWDKTAVSGIMDSGTSNTAATGTTTATGDYTLISSGTVANTAATNISANGYLKGVTNASTDLGGNFQYAVSSVTSGNFDGNKSGLAAQTAMVYTSDYSSNGGLYMRFGSATAGTYGSGNKELLNTSKKIGNPTLTDGAKLVENFAENPYQLQNYLQVTTGDWNNDGFDEVAVYIPEEGNSRIVVYALQLTDSDNRAEAYLNPSKWSVVWTYYLKEGAVVSNMVSLVSGDVNLDGTDDLAATWGYYYGPDNNVGSTAVVMFGAKGTAMLNKSQQFSLKYGVSDIVRASFAFGDMAGSDADVLVLCGQSDADLKAGNTQTRYVALYDWNGEKFTSNVYQNFNLFQKDNGNYTWPIMSAHNDKFYSLPLCTANTAMISQGLGGGGDLLYFDSLIIEYTDKGLSLKEAWDNTTAMQQNVGSCVEYVEYGAVAGDFTGQTGAGALVTMTQTLNSISPELTATYTITGSHQQPVYASDYYYRSWFHRLFHIQSWYTFISGYTTVADSTPVLAKYRQMTMGKAYMVVVDPSTAYKTLTQTDFSASICLANTDADSSYMSYGGKHYYTYTDPEVLAVLASPPCFSDLVNRDDLSANYAESTTSYSSSTGSGSGQQLSATIKVGAYVSYEHDFQVFGVTVASVEAEAAVTAGFTFETEKMSTLEQTVTYNATSGEDMIAFYSIPMEIYEYKSYVPDGAGGYKEVLTTVNIPHEAAVRLLSLNEYEFIAKDYSVLPKIADNVLTHDIGNPATYPTSTDGYNVIAKYIGTPSAVGFSSTPGGSGISQEIAMSKEKSTSFSASVGIEAKAGAGAGGFKVGIIAGAEVGAGFVKISTDGNSFSGEMQNMPIEAQPYSYGMNWRIFCYKYSDGGTEFPVVSYLVSDVQNPPSLPDNFAQDMSATTEDSISLNWSYDKNIAGFKIYRYYEFPEGSGSYEVAFVPFTKAIRYDASTGSYYFSYLDEGLSPYTEYKYQIKVVRAENPKESIYSEAMICRTKTTVGYPTIHLGGLNEDGLLPIYPDADAVVSVSLDNPESYNGLSYQWQKLVNGDWTNVPGKTGDKLTISNAGAADNGEYRCRINVIYYDSGAAQNYYISAFSDPVTTAYSKRTPIGNLSAEEILKTEGSKTLDGLKANIELYSANTGHAAAPSGNVTFTVKGTDSEYSKTVALIRETSTKYFLDVNAEKQYSTASLDIPSLPNGVYTISAYYSGSRVFKDKEIVMPDPVLLVIGDGSAHQLSLATTSDGSSVTKFEYGKEIWPTLVSIGKDIDGTIGATLVTGATYKLWPTGAEDGSSFTAGSITPNVGSYKLEAKKDGVLIASQEFTVVKKPITVSVKSQTDVSAGVAVTEHPPEIECSDLNALATLNLSYTAINSAGNTAILDASTEPGKYTVTACTNSTTPLVDYNNYSVTYVSGTYTIIGATYRLKAVAQDFTSGDGTRPVGTIGISNKSQNEADYTAATAVLLYAIPEAGYQVDTWTAKFNNNDTKTQVGGNTYGITTQAQTVTVTATFKPTVIKLATVVDPTKGGTISCTDPNFSSGAAASYGAEYSFNATPEAGYHFSTWKIVAGGTTTTQSGTANADGSNKLDITVGNASMTLYAVFERDAYALTLSGEITAYYMYDNDNDATTPQIKRKVISGTSVRGDTAITVEPKIGYQAAPGKLFTVNGSATDHTSSHVFTISGNTTVSLETVRNTYAVTLTSENGAVAAAVNGVTATNGELAAVNGGSTLAFVPHADRGYVFDHWTVNGEDVAVDNSTKTLTIAELGSDTNVIAVFVPNTAYTAKASVSNATRGTMNYSLYDIYGNLVGEANAAMPSDGIEVYKGESITFAVSVTVGSMIEQWKVNDTNTYTTQKTRKIDAISGNINAVAYLKAASSYSVNFLAGDESGSALAAKIDDVNITSGNLQYGGSDLVLSATPADGQMLDFWTVTEGGLMVAEKLDPVADTNGNKILDPIYRISPLKQNITVRAHFTGLKVNEVSLPDSTTMGVSQITYVTPIQPIDDGIRALTTENVRNGGTVRMTFSPQNGYDTSIAKLEDVLKGAANSDVSVEVVKDAGVYSATISNLTLPIALSETDIFYTVYHITLPSGVTASTATAKADDLVTLTVTPAKGYDLSSLSVDKGVLLVEPVSSAKLIYTFTMPESDVKVDVAFTKKSSGGGTTGGDTTGGGTTGGGGGAVTPGSQTIPASGNGTTTDVKVTLTKDLAAMEMDKAAIEQLGSSSGTVSFDFSSLNGVTSASIPANVFGAISGASGIDGLSISLPDASVTFDSAALAAIGAAGSGNVTLKATKVDSAALTKEQQALIGDRPVIDLTLTAGSKTVSDFDAGTVKVSVPYTLRPGENPDAVVVWYLNDKGTLECINGKYVAASGSVVFTTDHFSKYVVGILPFKDVSRNNWYFDSVSFASANGLFSGISDTSFAPDTSMTRAMLVTVLWRMEKEPIAKKDCEFKDVIASSWYASAVAWASEKGLVSGFGNGNFGAEDVITREQMAVILMNYAKYKGYEVSSTVDIQSFGDSASISTWASDAMKWANAQKLISGTGDNLLTPKGEATRSQVAAILMRFIENIDVK